jgi:hypothetical protein
MTNENDLMQKLMISKKIMDKHRELPRNTNGDIGSISEQRIMAPDLQSFEAPNASYNIPQEFMQENVATKIPKYVNSSDRIMSSKLPDAIKQLMIEHPINQPNSMAGPTLSDELVEKAARLMGTSGQQIQENTIQRPIQKQTVSDNKEFRQMLKEVVKEVLSENGVIVESTSKSNDVFSFKVGKHIFEGKVTKVKKLQ